jgi:hypothetical protein
MTNLHDIMPLLRPNFGYFVLMTILIGFTAISLHHVLEHGSEYWKKAIEKITWSLKIRDRDITIVRPGQETFDGQWVDRNLYEA